MTKAAADLMENALLSKQEKVRRNESKREKKGTQGVN